MDVNRLAFDRDGQVIWAAADWAIFDIVLFVALAGVDRNDDFLAATWTDIRGFMHNDRSKSTTRIVGLGSAIVARDARCPAARRPAGCAELACYRKPLVLAVATRFACGATGEIGVSRYALPIRSACRVTGWVASPFCAGVIGEPLIYGLDGELSSFKRMTAAVMPTTAAIVPVVLGLKPMSVSSPRSTEASTMTAT